MSSQTAPTLANARHVCWRWRRRWHPGEWEAAHGLNLRDPSGSHSVNAKSGYSMLEDLFNGFATKND